MRALRIRSSPSSNALRDAFRLETIRRQRKSDGTIPLDGVRFEIPARYRHFREVTVRYARWDLSHVLLVDRISGDVLGRLWPLDKTRNAEGIRKPLDPPETEPPPASGIAPLLERLMARYRESGLPVAYLPKDDLGEETSDE